MAGQLSFRFLVHDARSVYPGLAKACDGMAHVRGKMMISGSRALARAPKSAACKPDDVHAFAKLSRSSHRREYDVQLPSNCWFQTAAWHAMACWYVERGDEGLWGVLTSKGRDLRHSGSGGMGLRWAQAHSLWPCKAMVKGASRNMHRCRDTKLPQRRVAAHHEVESS